jgi:hypothetical protein
MGFFGEPPSITFGSFGCARLMMSGGVQAGFRCLPLMRAVPVHCWLARPTPTG